MEFKSLFYYFKRQKNIVNNVVIFKKTQFGWI